ncbi:AMP-binding protein, partial [Streptomyces sp. NPDC058964]|uniref:AMP-binding protein n=1 Tax=Streptomyces sp. NPDC058964 TaxID=3346681 RepID=UPI00369C565F
MPSTAHANLAAILVDSAARHPDRTAVRLDGATLTYAELDEASARAASLLLAAGVKPGDRVGLMLPNVPAFAVLYYAILRVGAVVVPMNPLLKAREVEYHLDDSAASLLFAPHQAQHALQGAQAGGAAARGPAARRGVNGGGGGHPP